MPVNAGEDDNHDIGDDEEAGRELLSAENQEALVGVESQIAMLVDQAQSDGLDLSTHLADVITPSLQHVVEGRQSPNRPDGDDSDDHVLSPPQRKRRGRPLGSKNKDFSRVLPTASLTDMELADFEYTSFSSSGLFSAGLVFNFSPEMVCSGSRTLIPTLWT